MVDKNTLLYFYRTLFLLILTHIFGVGRKKIREKWRGGGNFFYGAGDYYLKIIESNTKC